MNFNEEDDPKDYEDDFDYEIDEEFYDEVNEYMTSESAVNLEELKDNATTFAK